MDQIDVAQQYQMEDVAHTLANRRLPAPGLTHCERVDCGEPISVLRQSMGARLCVDCATADEQEARRWAPRGQG